MRDKKINNSLKKEKHMNSNLVVQIVKSGNKELALDIENNGYEKIISEVSN